MPSVAIRQKSIQAATPVMVEHLVNPNWLREM